MLRASSDAASAEIASPASSSTAARRNESLSLA